MIDEPPHEEMTKEKAQREAIVRALRHHGGKRRDAAPQSVTGSIEKRRANISGAYEVIDPERCTEK